MRRPTITPYGEHGLLVEVPAEEGPSAVMGWARSLRAAGLPGVVDVVPAARSVLLHLAPGSTPEAVGQLVAQLAAQPATAAPELPLVELPVVYDGPDLEQVAELTGLDVGGVVAAHTGGLWRAAFAGFAPGFTYLTGGDDRLTVPRRPDPRTRVPAGSVALAAGYSAVYPRESPGGWLLIGHTGASLWDIERDPPALVTPGQQVRFVAATG